MKRLEGYLAGANLGHWISQYGNKGQEHFSTYIVEDDIKKIASWGMDHVRVPVDYPIFEDDASPGVYRETGLQYIDRCLAWCQAHGLNMILDLHKAPGFFFGDGERNTLFTDPAMQQRFIDIWAFFARRYRHVGQSLVFELLNELVWDNSDPWNALWHKTVAAIREIDPDRVIIVGGNHYNSVFELHNLMVLEDDPNVVYTFHMYEPHFFTHQRASWSSLKDYLKPVEYPIAYGEHEDYLRALAQDNPLYQRPVVDRRFLLDHLEAARLFMEHYDLPLYCGEFGVISHAGDESALRWYRDVCGIFNAWGVGHAVWSYRGFSRVTEGDDRHVPSDALIQILSAKPN